MRRIHTVATRFALAGLTAISLGTALVVVGFVSNPGTPAFADTAPYELYCPGTPVGNIVLNNVVTDGTITPSAPTEGQQFNLTDFQSTVTLPNSIASAAQALGNSAITGSAGIKVDATGATPASVASAPIPIDTPIPSPVPAAGLTLTLPTTPGSVGPFTASGGAISLTVDPTVSLTVNVSGSALNLTCTPYPNNSAPSGITATAPTAAKASPVIASATTGGTTTTTSGSASTTSTTSPQVQLTGPYELYCPGTPVGNIALNDAQTVASISPASPDSGSSFNVTGYQTTVSLPSALASAAAAVNPGQPLTGSATGQLDVTGATPTTLTTGTESFSVNIPSPVPDAGLPLQVPSTPGTLGPFTASGDAITVTQDPATSLTLVVAGQNLTLTCTAFPNDSVTPSGITTSPEPTDSLAPIIATSASTSPTSSTTTSSSPSTSTTTTSSTTTSTAPATSTTTTSTTSSSSSTTSTTTTGGTTTTTKAAGTTTTAASPSTGSGGGTSTPTTVAASSSNLAFTGPSTGLRAVGMAGMVLIVFGLVLLALVDLPRRAMARLAPAWHAATRYRPDLTGAAGRGTSQLWSWTKAQGRWFMGR